MWPNDGIGSVSEINNFIHFSPYYEYIYIYRVKEIVKDNYRILVIDDEDSIT